MVTNSRRGSPLVGAQGDEMIVVFFRATLLAEMFLTFYLLT